MTMKQIGFALVFAASALSVDAAFAQRWFVPAAVGYGAGAGYGYGYGYGGVGTPASLEGQAMADMVRSQGEYNAMTSGAMINYEEARGKYIENQKQWTELYQMRQRVRQEQAVQAEQDKRVRTARVQEYKETHPSNLPPRLVSMQLDPSTGKIQWPKALQLDAFAAQRSDLEALFATRAHTGTTAELSQAIAKKVKEMQAELRKRIRDIVTQDYVDARKFLDSLALEGQVPLG